MNTLRTPDGKEDHHHDGNSGRTIHLIHGWFRQFLRKEIPEETNGTDFIENPGAAFQLERLAPLAVFCLIFGWLYQALFIDSETIILSSSRWDVWPLAVLGCIGSFCGMRHFIRPKRLQWPLLAAVCLFTIIVGVRLLLWFQQIAEIYAENRLHAAAGATLYLWFIKFVGICYQWANPENSNLVQKIVGYACGVGICEEGVKLLPLYLLVRFHRKIPFVIDFSFRSFLILGFFSGLGFGIGENLACYSILNGNTTYQGQMTRWFACAPSHAIYTVIDAAFLWKLIPRIEKETDSRSRFCWYLGTLAAIALLHGIYDSFADMGFFLGLMFDAISLILLFYVVRWASTGNPFQVEKNEVLAFSGMSVRTFGKTFAKLYLVTILCILVFGWSMCGDRSVFSVHLIGRRGGLSAETRCNIYPQTFMNIALESSRMHGRAWEPIWQGWKDPITGSLRFPISIGPTKSNERNATLEPSQANLVSLLTKNRKLKTHKDLERAMDRALDGVEFLGDPSIVDIKGGTLTRLGKQDLAFAYELVRGRKLDPSSTTELSTRIDKLLGTHAGPGGSPYRFKRYSFEFRQP